MTSPISPIFSPPPAGPPDPPARGERPLALLLLLPGALFAWPFAGAPLAGDPFPHLAGSAWMALAALPAALCAAWMRRTALTAPVAALAACIAAGALSAMLGAPADKVELLRAAVHAAAAFALCASASALGPAGRETCARGLVVLGLAFVAGAFGLRGSLLAGALKNTGALSQAALPGAVIGALMAVRGRGRAWRALGALAFLGFAAHAGRAPVLAGLLAAGGALLAAALAARVERRSRLALLGAALLLPAAFLGLRAAPTGGGDLAARIAGDTRGGSVRLAVWRQVPALLGDHLFLGVGPGQMQATFPPYRDPAEIAASSHGSCADHATEIDHLHNDVLEGLSELGLLGGLPWLAFLGLVALRAWRALRGTEPALAALGAAGLALLANALAHSPLLFHAAPAAGAFALFGALSARPGARPFPPVGLLALGLCGGAAWLGLPLIVHGRALSAALRGRTAAILSAERGAPVTSLDAQRVAADLERALAALPGSVPALLRQAEWTRIQGGDALPVYERVLARRPHDLEALQQLAFLALTTRGDVDAARAHWSAALALDPGHPKVLRNLVDLELDYGAVAAALGHLDALEGAGCLDPSWLEGVAARLLFAGRGDEGRALLARGDARFAAREGEPILALSKELEAAGKGDLAYALESDAHHLWAREHVAQGSYANAVRSYRQALRPTHSRHPGGAPLLRLELAAALVLAGDAGAARRELAEPEPLDPAAEPRLPEWARAALRDL